MDRDKIIIDNHNLIYSYAIKNHLELDDWYDVLAIALVKAAENFNESFGYSFSTFAYKVMKNAVLREKMKFRKDCLAYTLTLDGFQEDVPIVEIIPNDDNNIFDVKLPKQLTEEEKEILIYKVCGFTNKDISQIIGVRKEKVSRIISGIRVKWKNEKFDR